LVTGPLGRGLAFGIDFVIAVRTGLAERRRRV
jgi:transketolase